MTEGMPPLGLNILHDLGEGVILVLRIVLALAGALVAWWVSSPLTKGISRLVFRRPPSPAVLTLCRLTAAVLVALALFYFFPLGFGGGGSGGGRGSGVGPGTDGRGSDKGGGPDKGSGQKDGKQKQPEVKPGKTTRIEIQLSELYNKKRDGRWYLIESKPPAKTLEEVEQYLKAHKGQFQNMDIILYANAPEPGHYAVKALEDLGERYKLRTYLPKEYWGKKKAETPE